MIRKNRVRMGVLALGAFIASSSFSQTNKDTLKVSKHYNISEVVVLGNQVKRINSSAFNAVAIDTRILRNTNLNLSKALDRVTGIKIREDGGLGSQTNININGFTGKHVRLFIDGVPMEGAASSFGINNIPVGFARNIEVYKGVVPVELGGDALGGAINIVTDHSRNTFVDASYSYGSFNTHKSNISFGLTTSKGLLVRVNAYQNYSDNDYKVKTQYTDLQTNAVSDEESWFRRFHDRYHNEAVIAQIGLVNKSWADKLIFCFNYSNEYAQIQNANLMKIVFGGKYRTAQGWAPSLLYEKRNIGVEKLNFRLSARYDKIKTNNVDTLSRTYSWTGEYVENSYQGEGVPSLAEFNGYTLATVANLTYTLGMNHFFTLNDTYSNYHRKTTNSSANNVQSSASSFMRRVNNKNVLGLSYKFIPSNYWNILAFTKYYSSRVRGPVNVATSGRAEYKERSRDNNALGWGLAGTYFLLDKDFQIKLSYERTLRMPTDRELFGDGDYEEGEAALKPERSDNVNLNFSYQKNITDDHSISADLAFNYRMVNDYIIRTIGQKGTAVSSNHGKVLGLGMDASIRYYYKYALSLGASMSLQNTRDREHYNQIGSLSSTYNNRVPNLPYAFSNVDASYTLNNIFAKQTRLIIGYNMRYVHKFFRSWSGDGAKLYVPNQLSHDASLTYMIKGGRYNVALEANNFTDALLYDNYSLQKPGRNFSIKFRYTFYKQ